MTSVLRAIVEDGPAPKAPAPKAPRRNPRPSGYTPRTILKYQVQTDTPDKFVASFQVDDGNGGDPTAQFQVSSTRSGKRGPKLGMWTVTVAMKMLVPKEQMRDPIYDDASDVVDETLRTLIMMPVKYLPAQIRVDGAMDCFKDTSEYTKNIVWKEENPPRVVKVYYRKESETPRTVVFKYMRNDFVSFTS